MSDPSKPVVEPGNLRLLRRLVTTLMAVMIFGFILIVSLFVIRLSDTGPNLPDQITLPDGAVAETFTVGKGWYAVVTQDGQILIFDQSNGKLRQTIDIE